MRPNCPTLLDLRPSEDNFTAMSPRTVQLVLHYDGTHFAGWQRQPSARTVQGVLEEALGRLCNTHVPVTGAGRTDAGVHARGQAAGIRIDDKWTATSIRKALNALLPDDVWVVESHAMREDFHARYSATSRRYAYFLGTDAEARSPFRRRYELAFDRPLDRALLDSCAERLTGTHRFLAFAVRGTAPDHDDHRCTIRSASWRDREQGRGLVFEVEANRFLHHMVRFLVGAMLDVGSGRRPASDFDFLLGAGDNSESSSPAPAHALYLDRVEYPEEMYLDPDIILERAGVA
jgi:tRNA pseudouridine38-40 synthase